MPTLLIEEEPQAQPGQEEGSQPSETNYLEEEGAEAELEGVELDENGYPVAVQQIEEVEAPAPEVEPAAVQPEEEYNPSAPTYWGPSGATAPTITDADEQQFITRADAIRMAEAAGERAAARAIQGFEASSAVAGYHMQRLADKAPEFSRAFGPEIRQVLASVADPQVRAKKETVTWAVMQALGREAALKGMDPEDAICKAADLIRKGRGTQGPTAIPARPGVGRVPSPSGGRSASASVASAVRRPGTPRNGAAPVVDFLDEGDIANIMMAPEVRGNRRR